MGFPRRDPAATASISLPGACATPVLTVRHLTIVPIDLHHAVAPPADDWAAALRLVAEERDRDAFERLFAYFAPRVKAYLIRTGSANELAEELAQEALVTVWRKAPLFDPARAAASTWIFTIARNLRVDAARQRPNAAHDEDGVEFDALEADELGAGERLDASRMAQRVREAMNRLPPEQVQVLRLSFYDDAAHARIAADLGIPLGTVKSRIRLAIAHLRRLLDV